MAKTAYISVRIDPELKAEAEKIFKELGMSVSEAITMFFRQVVLRRGLPFNIRLPNHRTTKRPKSHRHTL